MEGLSFGALLQGARERWGAERLIVVDGVLYYIEGASGDGVAFWGRVVGGDFELGPVRQVMLG